MEINIDNGMLNQSNEDFRKLVKDGTEEIFKIHHHANLILSSNLHEIPLHELKETRAQVKSYSVYLAEFIKQLMLKSTKYSTVDLENYANLLDSSEKLTSRISQLLETTLNKLREEIFECRIYSVRRTLIKLYKKKVTPVYNSFNRKWDQTVKKARSCHQIEKLFNQNAEKLKNMEDSTIAVILEKVHQITEDKNLCKKFRECKEIINKSVFEALKIHNSNRSLINKLLRKYSKPREFLPTAPVLKVYQAYHDKLITNITTLNKKKNKIVNEKKWTSKICEIDQFVNNIVASSSMKYNWKLRKKFVLLLEKNTCENPKKKL